MAKYYGGKRIKPTYLVQIVFNPFVCTGFGQSSPSQPHLGPDHVLQVNCRLKVNCEENFGWPGNC